MKRQRVWMTAALILLLLFALAPSAATAAIRLTFSDGNTTQVYYTPDSHLALAPASLGDYTFAVDTTASNSPGMDGKGSLSQTVSFFTGGASTDLGTVAPLTITADIITTVGSLMAGFVNSGDLASVNSAPLQKFTDPSDLQLQVVSGASSSGISGGNLVVKTSVNGTDVTASTSIPGQSETTGTALNTVNGYTLTSQVVISNLAHGVTGLPITASSTVTALVPEPLSLAIWCAGACGLALALRWRRKSRLATAG